MGVKLKRISRWFHWYKIRKRFKIATFTAKLIFTNVHGHG